MHCFFFPSYYRHVFNTYIPRSQSGLENVRAFYTLLTFSFFLFFSLHQLLSYSILKLAEKCEKNVYKNMQRRVPIDVFFFLILPVMDFSMGSICLSMCNIISHSEQRYRLQAFIFATWIIASSLLLEHFTLHFTLSDFFSHSFAC